MKNFLKVGQSDMGQLRLALKTRPFLWNRHDYRTSFDGTPFAGMDDIILRYSKPEKHEGNVDPMALVNDTDLVCYPAWGELPEAHGVVFDLMRRHSAVALGRVIVARLPMGGTIKAHADNYGDYAMRSTGVRFHVCVQGLPGCLFHCGGETVQMKSDEVWWFNHREVHAAENNSADERIHLLVDIETG